MPEMSGTEAAKQIRESGIDVTIIALTASVMEGKKDMMLAAGMNDFLMKPIIMADLQKMLMKWIPAGKLLDPPPKPAAPNASDDENHSEFWEKIGQIEGLSLPKGLANVEGQRDTYAEMLRLSIKEIEKCDRNLNEFLTAGDMRNFCIEVHSIKSSLASIGVMELAQKARELEIASDREDDAFCAMNLPPLRERLGALRLRIKEAFSEINQEDGAIEIPPELPPVLHRLADAFGEMDIIAIDEVIQRLTAFSLTGAIREEVEQITDAVLMADFDCALGLIRELTGAASL